MREIKFRGLSVNGKWFYGLLSISQGHQGQPTKGYYISNNAGMPWAYQVRPETVGQLSEFNDKEGREIWEGDIWKHPDYDEQHPVEFSDGAFHLTGYPLWVTIGLNTNFSHAFFKDMAENGTIVGNIHEKS